MSTASAGIHSAGYKKSWFHDPLTKDVNTVKNTVDWYWNGSCVYGTSTLGYRYEWLTATGWGLKDNNWRRGAFCTYAYSNSYVHFKNGIFCAFTDTHTYYDRNNVRGYYNGTLWGQTSWSKSGFCSFLLSFHDKLRRTLN